MTGKSHMKIALSVSVFTANPVVIVSAVIGSLLPDFDSETSTISNLTLLRGWPFSKLRHRGVTHSLIALAVVTLSSYLIFKSKAVALGVFIGYLSHIISDMMTVYGLELLWPKRKKYKLGFNIRTGSPTEYAVVGMIIVVGFATAFKLWNWY